MSQCSDDTQPEEISTAGTLSSPQALLTQDTRRGVRKPPCLVTSDSINSSQRQPEPWLEPKGSASVSVL